MAEIGLLLLGTFGVFVFGHLLSKTTNFWSVIFFILLTVSAITLCFGFITSLTMLVGAL